MEAEVSLLMANQTMASPGKLMYDPFMGTGSMAYPIAHFGALVFGSDIDGRQMRGKDSVPGVLRAAEQYGVTSRILDLATFDITNHPDDTPYIPPTKPYELSHLVSDLVLFARYLLKPGGRLVFFLPTVTDEYEEVDIYTMLCDGMEVIANSLQDFGSWGRRLITIKKTTTEDYPPPTFAARDGSEGSGHVPAHKDFREKYFQGFKSPSQSPAVCDDSKPTGSSTDI
ncbi:hypothetical protein MD484_g3602, partial [Candolleomyces efflorescens]